MDRHPLILAGEGVLGKDPGLVHPAGVAVLHGGGQSAHKGGDSGNQVMAEAV